MHRLLAPAAALLLAIGAAPAVAQSSGTVAPPGNSGVSQYVESVPGAGGSQPPGSGHGTTPLSSRTLHALSAQGAAGRGAAALAAATAPAALQHPTRGGTHGGGATPSKSAPTLPAIPAASGSNGISPALPIVLAVALMGALALMLMRRRGSRPAA